MTLALTLISTFAGLVLIAVALRDVFATLFHQGARGPLSRVLMRGIWWIFHRLAPLRRGGLAIAGPTILLIIVSSWAALLALGWALIYWPHVPEGFYFSSTSGDGDDGNLVDALYLSLVTLATIGFGDITPVTSWLRLVTPIEALLGFGLLTGSISWLLSIYPTLLRRNSLAYELALLKQAEEERGIGLDGLRAEAAEDLYAELTSRLVAIQIDLVTFPVAYYFSPTDERYALSATMPYMLELAERVGDEDPAGLRLRGALMREAIDDFARATAERFHGFRSDSTPELLAAYARDHMRGERPSGPNEQEGS
jgi:hypothetical protein